MNEAIDFLHLLAVVLWIGGALFMTIVVLPSLSVLEPPKRGPLLGTISKRFTPIVWGSILILMITGFLKAPAHTICNVSTHYGMILNIKLLVVLLMVVIAAYITFVLGAKMAKLAPQPGTPLLRNL